MKLNKILKRILSEENFIEGTKFIVLKNSALYNNSINRHNPGGEYKLKPGDIITFVGNLGGGQKENGYMAAPTFENDDFIGRFEPSYGTYGTKPMSGYLKKIK